MAGVLVDQRARELGVDLAGVGPQKVVYGRVAWCGALLMEALYEGQN